VGPLLPLTIAVLLSTYLISDRVRGWWHSPVPLLPSFFFARTRLHALFAWVLFGLLVAGYLLWVERPPRDWGFYFFMLLVQGLFNIKFYDWILSTREWMAEQQARSVNKQQTPDLDRNEP
jgi:hypothetical protein